MSNVILENDDWNHDSNPATLQALDANLLPPCQYEADNIPIGIGRKLIVVIPIQPTGKIDVYINDTIGLTVDIAGMDNALRLANATLLAIHSTARPLAMTEIPTMS